MKTHKPFHISHICLHESAEMPALDLQHKGNYLVYWWKTIPLGDLYLEPGTLISKAGYYKKNGRSNFASA